MSGNPVILQKSAQAIPGRALAELTKLHLSLYISLSALAGHVLAQGKIDAESLMLGSWVLMLACGSAVLNNIQDRDWDLRFVRTRNRVLARNLFSLPWAKILATGLILIGLSGLFLSYESGGPLLLGLAALICYNGLYTPIKKISLWAMIPGTLCGMIPPAMGWTAVPGQIAVADLSGLIVLVAALAFWQLPHYLLVCLKQISGETKKSAAGHVIPAAPGFDMIWSVREIKCQILIWTVLFSLSMVLFLIQGWVDTSWIRMMVFSTALALPVAMGGILMLRQTRRYLGFCFGIINLSMLFFLIAVILDRL